MPRVLTYFGEENVVFLNGFVVLCTLLFLAGYAYYIIVVGASYVGLLRNSRNT